MAKKVTSSSRMVEAAPSRRGKVPVRLPRRHTTLETPSRAGDGESSGRPRKRRGDEVRQRVLQAALEHFSAFGFEGTSTRAVAERAGVTHTLVLYHFQSKDQLWIATMEAAISDYTASVRSSLEASRTRPAQEGLRAFIEQFVRLSARLPQVHRMMTMEGNQRTERLQWIIENHLREHFTTVRDLIRRGQQEGSVRECDPARLYYLILGAGGTPFTIATEYEEFTGRDIFSEAEIYGTIAFIFDIVFK